MLIERGEKFLNGHTKEKKIVGWAIVVWSAVLLLCLGVCWSAFRTYRTLKQLQYDYLRSQAANIAASVEFAGRDLAMISLMEFQNRIEEIYSGNGAGLAELAVIGEDHKILADSDSQKSGDIFKGTSLEELFHSKRLYEERYQVMDGEPVYQVLLPVHMGSLKNQDGQEALDGLAFKVAAISLFVSSADFITREGKTNLFLTLLACALLVCVTFYYSIAVRGSLRSEARRARERQWVSLGQMSATLAHDIRNPLGAIKGLAQMLDEKIPLEDKTSSYAKTIVREAERLDRLVADLLLFARPKHPEPRAFLLKTLLDDVNALFEQRFHATGVQLEIEAETLNLPLITDYELLKRVFINLFENSVLAMSAGGRLAVFGRRDVNSNKTLLQIDDEGEGLPQQPERVFEPFYTTRTAGTGLGLTICVQIIESLGGAIRLKDKPVRGTSCTITLPLNP